MKKDKWIPKNGENVIICDKSGVPLSKIPKIFIGMPELSTNFPYVCQDKNTKEYINYARVEPYNEAHVNLWYLAEKVRKARIDYDKAYTKLKDCNNENHRQE